MAKLFAMPVTRMMIMMERLMVMTHILLIRIYVLIMMVIHVRIVQVVHMI